MELYKQYRPTDLNDVLGQSSVIRLLQQKIKDDTVPHAILLTGPSGTGKTTIARILRRILKCHPTQYTELDIGDVRGVDNIREIRQFMRLRPFAGQGKTKVWFLDEIANATRPAQEALLKQCLEDTPQHVYFLLATTDPQRLIAPLRNRCTEIKLKPLGEKDLDSLVRRVSTDEEVYLEDTVVKEIVEGAEGSARKALVLLDTIIRLKNTKDMLETLADASHKSQSIELCRALLDRNPAWSRIAKILRNVEGEEPERLRHMVLGYMRAVMLGGSPVAGKAYYIVCAFERNFYDSGHAGLAMVCWELIHNRK